MSEIITDKTISLKAKGLYAIIHQCLKIKDFTIYKENLIDYSKDGKKSFESAWKELKDKGYLKQHRLKNPNGQYYYKYIIKEK